MSAILTTMSRRSQDALVTSVLRKAHGRRRKERPRRAKESPGQQTRRLRRAYRDTIAKDDPGKMPLRSFKSLRSFARELANAPGGFRQAQPRDAFEWLARKGLA